MNEPPKRSGRKTGVTTIIYAALMLIVVFHLLSSLPSLYHVYRTYQQADMVYRLNEVSDELYVAVNNLGFERGRVNVVLLDAGPVADMEKTGTSLQPGGPTPMLLCYGPLASWVQSGLPQSARRSLKSSNADLRSMPSESRPRLTCCCRKGRDNRRWPNSGLRQ